MFLLIAPYSLSLPFVLIVAIVHISPFFLFLLPEPLTPLITAVSFSNISLYTSIPTPERLVMRTSVVMPLIFLFSANTLCNAGVDYYSGSDTTSAGDAVVVSFSSGAAQWSPVPSVTDVGVKRDTNGSGTIQLNGQQGNGSNTPYDVYMSATSSSLGFGSLSGYTGAAPSENGIGVTITTASTNNYSYASGTPSSALGNRVVNLYEPSGSGLVASYDGSQSNYFAWHATAASNTLFAIGWARYTVQGTTSLTIEEWAYNLASNTSSIVFGETGVSSGGGDNGGGDNGGGTVPEPTGLAIFGLASLGFALRRRR